MHCRAYHCSKTVSHLVRSDNALHTPELAEGNPAFDGASDAEYKEIMLEHYDSLRASYKAIVDVTGGESLPALVDADIVLGKLRLPNPPAHNISR
jgi:hypothetical protein